MPSGIPVDHTGKRFGRLLVISRAADTRSGKCLRKNYLCQCDCGVKKVVTAIALTSASTRSCGCLHRESIGNRSRTHGATRGATKSQTYQSWKGMRERVKNPRNSHFESYGGRGIKMDPRWDSFETFLQDMGERPKNHTLDRVDNDGNYCKENCRWATAREQIRNTTRTVTIKWRGYSRCLRDWANLFNVTDETLKFRLKNWGGDVERSFTTPFQNDCRRKIAIRSHTEVLQMLEAELTNNQKGLT